MLLNSSLKQTLSGTCRSFLRPVLFRSAERKLNRHVTRKVYQIRKFHTSPKNQRNTEKSQLLVAALEFARAHVPYYKKTISAEWIAKVSKDFRYMELIPRLTKEKLIELNEKLIPEGAPRDQLKRMKTGGSSGASAYVFYDPEAVDWSSATTWFCRRHHESWWNNLHLHFACDFGEEPVGKRSLQQRLHSWALNRENVFTLRFEAESLRSYLTKITYFRPQIVAAHPSTMYALACCAEKQPESYARLFPVFESSGEMLHDYQRSKITKVFGCKVVNRYGLAEAGVVAYQLDADNPELQPMDHLVHFHCQASGQPEEVCITTLRNKAMPLINYQPGDVARFRREEDGQLVVSEIEGRIHDRFTIGATTIMSHSLMDVLDHRVGGVKEFQVHRSRSSNEIKLLVVPETALDAASVEAAVERYVGARIPVFVATDRELIRTGWRQKFRHLVDVE